MKQSEILNKQLQDTETEYNEVCERLCKTNSLSADEQKALNKQSLELFRKIQNLNLAVQVEQRRELDVGDGCTLKYWTDGHACTVIKKTAKTITIQRDKAVRHPDFKPEWVTGGFSAICTNNNEQRWVYERDPEGQKWVCHWSEKHGCYQAEGSLRVYPGRHEFYDYNF